MKKILIILGITKILSIVSTYVTPIWAVVEFILYLVKDKPFNWWSVYLFIISVALLISCVFIMAIVIHKEEKNIVKNTFNIFNKKPRENRFQKKMREMMEKADKQKNQLKT